MFKKRILSAVIVLMFIFSSIGMTAAFAADTLASVLTWDVVANNQLKSDVTANLNLVNSIALNGETVSVAWTSSDESAISSTGVVTRALETKNVTLTATAAGSTVAFDVAVTSLLNGNVIADYSHNFESGLDSSKKTETAAGNLAFNFEVTDDYVSGTNNKVLSINLTAGKQQMTSADANKCTKDLTYTGTFYNGKEQTDSVTYSWKVMPEAYTGTHGTYYRGYRTDFTDRKYWAAVYVTDDGEGNEIVNPQYVYKYHANGVSYINEDGSPYVPTNKQGAGTPGFATFTFKAQEPQENNGVYAYSFRYGMRKFENDGSVRNINSYTQKSLLKLDIDGTRFYFDYDRGSDLGNGWKTGGITAAMADGLKGEIQIDETGTLADASEALYVGKTADTLGIRTNTNDFDRIVLPQPGEWAEIAYVMDLSKGTATMYFNGKPVFFRNGSTYSSIIAAKYGSEGNTSKAPTVGMYVDSNLLLDKEFMFDDFTAKYISAQGQANEIANSLKTTYIKANAEDGDKLVLDTIGNYITYAVDEADASKLTIDGNIATAHASVGFGVDTAKVIATATVGDKTATKDIEIKINQKGPFVIKGVSTYNSENAQTYAGGTKISSVSVQQNANSTGLLFLAIYDEDGSLITIKRMLATNTDKTGQINFVSDKNVTYKAFILESSSPVATNALRPLSLKAESLKEAEGDVKVFIVGDNTNKLASVESKFTSNVTFDRTYANSNTKEILANGGIDYIIANANEGDHVIFKLGTADARLTTQEYNMYLTHAIRTVQQAGLVPVIVASGTDIEGINSAYYIEAATVVRENFGNMVPRFHNGSMSDIAAFFASQAKSRLLPIAKYVK